MLNHKIDHNNEGLIYEGVSVMVNKYQSISESPLEEQITLSSFFIWKVSMHLNM